MNQQNPDYERTLGHLLSCQTQNDPDKWRKPALSEEKPYSDPERLKTLVGVVEDHFDLPQGTLTTGGKKFSEHSLSDIRAALSLHILNQVKIPLGVLAPIIGFKDHSGPLNARKKARKYLEAKDPAFERVYLIIQDIAV
jgi:hypothetical protein